MIRLLHVDDEIDILEIAKLSLEMHGTFEVTMCLSGNEALRAVRSFTPDILLLDYMMPELTGPETLRELREYPGLDKVPVIFLTARAHEDDHKELWELGALDVIAKPFDSMKLGKRIEDALVKTG